MPDTMHDPAKDAQEDKMNQSLDVCKSYVRYTKEAVKDSAKQISETRLVIDSALEHLKSIESRKKSSLSEIDFTKHE